MVSNATSETDIEHCIAVANRGYYSFDMDWDESFDLMLKRKNIERAYLKIIDLES